MTRLSCTKRPENGACIVPNNAKIVQRGSVKGVAILSLTRGASGAPRRGGVNSLTERPIARAARCAGYGINDARTELPR